MENSNKKARRYTKMVIVVQDRIDATFNEILNRRINMNPSWLYAIYNEFTLVQENSKMSLKEKLQRLLTIIKELFVGTVLHIDQEAAMSVNKKQPIKPFSGSILS